MFRQQTTKEEKQKSTLTEAATLIPVQDFNALAYMFSKKGNVTGAQSTSVLVTVKPEK